MRTFLVITALFLGGCASGYSEFYKSVPNATPELIAKTRETPPPKVPALEHAGGAPADIMAAYARRGYGLIGYSSFNSGRRESDRNALAQGEDVEADLVVVVDPTYTGSISTSVPITTPTTTTSNTTGTATAFGPGGPVTAYDNATTTTYGTQTSYYPMTIHRFDYGALYLYKRHVIFGANYRDLNDSERQALQSNKGVYITSLINGTPAFRSDVLPGDIVVALDGQPVFGAQAFSDQLGTNRGRTVAVTIVRGGQTLSKSVALEQ